jgi:hypothetical protein
MRRWPALALLLACGCSGPKRIEHDQLENEMRRLRSLASEVALFRELQAQGRISRAFAGGHAAYLRRTAEAEATNLEQARPAPGVESELGRARELARRLVSELQ